MASERPIILDKNHGFMRFIIKNQIERNNFDHEEKLKKHLRNSDERNEISKSKNPAPLSEELIKNMNGIYKNTASKLYKGDHINNTNDMDLQKLETYDTAFKLEFLPKTGCKINLAVSSQDSPESVTKKLHEKYPLDAEKRGALTRRLQLEMKKFRRHGN